MDNSHINKFECVSAGYSSKVYVCVCVCEKKVKSSSYWLLEPQGKHECPLCKTKIKRTQTNLWLLVENNSIYMKEYSVLYLSTGATIAI